MSQSPPSPSQPSKLAIAIDYDALRSLMLEYIEESNARSIELGATPDTLSLERQLTLSGFLVWLRERRREGQ